MFRDVGHIPVDSIDATRAIDETRWQYVFKRNVASRRARASPPPSGILGKMVLEKLRRFPVCTVSGDPGTGKSRGCISPTWNCIDFRVERSTKCFIRSYTGKASSNSAMDKHLE